MPSRIKAAFYHNLQKTFNSLRAKGYDTKIILDAMSKQHGIAVHTLRNHLNLYEVEVEAYENFNINGHEYTN